MTMWDVLLKIKQNLRKLTSGCSFISVKMMANDIQVDFDHHLVDASFSIDFLDSDPNEINLLSSCQFEVRHLGETILSPADLKLLEEYLPYALLSYYSKISKRCYAISHFAQTLDGRIASFSGESKWIGNQENLVHAHRMRALCDAILIGAKTLAIDDPRLNVRLVKGEDPIKIVLGGDTLIMDKYKAFDDSTILFCQNHAEQAILGEKIILDKNPFYDTKKILEILFEKGIHSVYIEGGCYTTSHFLKERSIDQVQLHISPKILGSGTNSFSFEGILGMDQAIQFSNAKFMAMGNDVMFIGNLK